MTTTNLPTRSRLVDMENASFLFVFDLVRLQKAQGKECTQNKTHFTLFFFFRHYTRHVTKIIHSLEREQTKNINTKIEMKY